MGKLLSSSVVLTLSADWHIQPSTVLPPSTLLLGQMLPVFIQLAARSSTVLPPPYTTVGADAARFLYGPPLRLVRAWLLPWRRCGPPSVPDALPPLRWWWWSPPHHFCRHPHGCDARGRDCRCVAVSPGFVLPTLPPGFGQKTGSGSSSWAKVLVGY